MRWSCPASNCCSVPPIFCTLLVGRFAARLPRVVMADINRGPFLDRAAMDGDDLVFQNGRVVDRGRARKIAPSGISTSRAVTSTVPSDLTCAIIPRRCRRVGSWSDIPRMRRASRNKGGTIESGPYACPFIGQRECPHAVQCGSQPGPRSSRTAGFALGKRLRSASSSSPSMGVSAARMIAIDRFRMVYFAEILHAAGKKKVPPIGRGGAAVDMAAGFRIQHVTVPPVRCRDPKLGAFVLAPVWCRASRGHGASRASSRACSCSARSRLPWRFVRPPRPSRQHSRTAPARSPCRRTHARPATRQVVRRHRCAAEFGGVCAWRGPRCGCRAA